MFRCLPHRYTSFAVESLERRLLLYHTYFGDGDSDAVWSFSDISFSFANATDGSLSGVTPQQVRDAVYESFALWAGVSPRIFHEELDPNPNFVPDSSYDPSGLPTIRVGKHSIDGAGNTLAHAQRPGDDGWHGDVHYDSGEQWSYGHVGGGPFDIIETSLHEIGHAIGLDHEPAPPGGQLAIMNPNYAGFFSGRGTGYLLPDDINGIRSIYGTGLGYALDRFGTMYVAGTSSSNSLTLSYNTGTGQITMSSSSIGSFTRLTGGINKIVIFAGDGNDFVTVDNVPFPVEVVGGSGNDQLRMLGTSSVQVYSISAGNQIGGHAAGSLYSGIESIFLQGNTSGDTFNVNAAPTIPVTLSGHNGNDNFYLHALSPLYSIFGDNDNDYVEIDTGTSDTTSVTINCGGGSDLVRINRLARPLSVSGGDGNDAVDIGRGRPSGSITGNVTVSGDNGDDVVNLTPQTMQTNVVTANVSFFAGNDNDTFNIGGGLVSSFAGTLTYDGGSHTGPGNNINIDDTARTIDANWSVNPTNVGRGVLALVNFSNTSRIILNCGSGNDDVAVASGVNPIVEVYGNNGNDEFIVGGGLMDGGAGPIAEAFNGGNGTDQITYDDHLRTGGVIWDIHPTQVIYGGIFVLSTNAFEAVGILAGNGNDTIVFYNDIGSKPVTVDAGGGDDSIDTNHCRALNLTITGGAGNDTLEVDDVGIPTGTIFQYVVYANQVMRYDFVAEYYVNYGAVEQIKVFLPAQQNSVYIVSTTAVAWAGTAIYGNTSSDTVVINARDAAGNATIQGPVYVLASDGSDVVEIDATASSVPFDYALGVDFFGANPVLTGIGNAVTIQSSESIRLRAGGGNDTFSVNTYPWFAGPALEVLAGNGDDTLNLGNNDIPTNIATIAAFNYNGQGGTDTFNLANSAATGTWTYENTTTDILVNRTSGGAYFARFFYANVEQLNVSAGANNDVFNLFALNAGQGLTFMAGAGTNGVNLIDTTAIRGPIFYDNGNAGGINNINKLTISSSPITLHVEPNSIGAHPSDTFFGPGGSLGFNAVTNISLTMGSGTDVVYARPNPTAAITLRGGNPTTAPGDTIHLALANALNYQIGPGPLGVGFRITSTNNQPLDYSEFETVNVDAVAPVASAGFAVDPQQSLAIQFSEVMGKIPSPATLSLKKVNPTQAIPAASMSAVTTSTLLTLTFPGYPQGLPDGNYRLTLPSTSATDLVGNSLANTFTFDFFVLAGDANRDRSVDTIDFNILAANFSQSGKTFSQGDFNYDQSVDTVDFNLLASKFGQTLSAAGAGRSTLDGMSAQAAAAARVSSLFAAAPISDLESLVATTDDDALM